MEGLVRAAACVPTLYLGDVEKNVQETVRMMADVRRHGVTVAVFPELGLTGATCGDLFAQSLLHQQVTEGLIRLAKACPEGLTAVVGAPLQTAGGRYNAAVVITTGRVIGAAVKTYLPDHGDAYEKRWFSSGYEHAPGSLLLGTETLPLSTGLVFRSEDGVAFGVEVGHDLWSPIPPSTYLALSGAEIILNPSAVQELVGRGAYIIDRIRQQSIQGQCGYVHASSGMGESTTDLVFGGRRLIFSCGTELAKSPDGVHMQGVSMADVEILAIRSKSQGNSLFADCRMRTLEHAQEVAVPSGLMLPDDVPPLLRPEKLPFIPSRKEERFDRCSQILSIQAAGLARRLSVTNGKAVIGISGGLDSTLALLVACGAMDRLGRPRQDIIGITMPCFGTSGETIRNAKALMTALQIHQREIPIHEAVRSHFRDIGQDEADHSVTYENAQARERTQVLMDVANTEGALVVGTGDLSELALGWCTYNGDHMSMYGVNGGVPKTLVRWIVATAAEMEGFAPAQAVLRRILDTPISPELLPPDAQGNISQATESLVGPYALHDFFLYYTIRYGFAPKRIYQLAQLAFQGDFTNQVILKWLKHFYHRFFTQQFKRSCMPDGVKVGTVALSPRGDWKMPSDALAAMWVRAADQLQET